MTTLELLKRTIDIQQGKEKPVASENEERLNGIKERCGLDDNTINMFKEMFGMK